MRKQQLMKTSPVDKGPPVKVLPPNTVEVGGQVLSVFEELELVTAADPPETETVEPDSEIALTTTPKVEKGKKHGSKNIHKSKLTLKHKKGQKAKYAAPPAEARLKLPEANVRIIDDYNLKDAPVRPNNAFIRYMERPAEELAEEVEYDLDEEDCAWLMFVNARRSKKNLQLVKPDTMEVLMDRLEKECYFQMQTTGVDNVQLIDDDAVCCVCMDGECQNSNAILFCDMCNIAVHQECFGVPYIPEGQWWCRRCLQSPSQAVDCVLCPNKGGAFKQTDDGRWAHVVCAIWVPEVCFANTVFLEPIDCIVNIPSARWKLNCFICKRKNSGACIQCYKANCYQAFHVTCAQQAGLCMRMETTRTSSNKVGVTVKKTAFCDAHAPDDFILEKNGQPFQENLTHARRILADKRSAPPVSIPVIPADRLTHISSIVLDFPDKAEFVTRLVAYWKLKRKSRNGVPLLRRLQAASLPPHGTIGSIKPMNSKQVEETRKSHAYFVRLRQDLERARLLCELIRKREKIKREKIYTSCNEIDMRIQPMNYFLKSIVDELVAKDVQKIFTQPVDTEEVPDYSSVVTNPMDFSTIQTKIFKFDYNSVDDMFGDFQLMINNCLLYNAKDTVFYRAGIKMQEIGGVVFRAARRKLEKTGYDKLAGTLLKNAPEQPEEVTDEDLSKQIEQVLENTERHALPYDKHLSVLEDALDASLNLSHPLSKKKKFLRIKTEIGRLKKRKRLVEGGTTPVQDDLPDSEDTSVSSSVGTPSSIRERLRSVDDQRLIERRLSQTDRADLTNEHANQELSLTDSNYFKGPTFDPHTPRPGRGRPRKLGLGRGRGKARVPGQVTPSSSKGSPVGKSTITRGVGRTRGGRSKRLLLLRRSTRSTLQKQQLATSGEKEAEPTPSGSRQGSPNRSSPNRARQTREKTPKTVNNNLPFVNNVANVTARAPKVQSPKSIETAAKSIICERVQLEKANKKSAEVKNAKSNSVKLKRNCAGAMKMFIANSFKGASQPLRQKAPSKLAVSENHVVEDAIRHVAKTGKRPLVTTLNKKGFGKSPKLSANPRVLFNENDHSVSLPPTDEQQARSTFATMATRVIPLTNGALEKSDPVSAAVGIISTKMAAQGVNNAKRRLRGSAPVPANINNNNLVSGSNHASPVQLKKPDSFSVYRSGGDQEIHSYSEGESANDDDEVEEEEEDDEDDDDDDDDDDEDEEDEEIAQDPVPQNPPQIEEEQAVHNESDNDSSEPRAVDDSESSESDSSSSESSTSSSSLSSDSTGSSKASSSSSMTTPRHFNARRTHKSNRHSSTLHSASSAQSQPREVRQQISPSINNNNNVTFANKETEGSPNDSSTTGS